jgi:iron complex outermembrane receptor protein
MGQFPQEIVMRDASRPCALIVCLFASSLLLAEPASAGSLAGSVRAPDGARLPGVVLTVFDAEGQPVHHAISDGFGLFRIEAVREGIYTVEAALDGFETQRIAALRVGDRVAAEVDLTLQVATVREAVDVLGAGPRDSVELGSIRGSPARDVADAVADTPGVTRLRKAAVAGDIVVRGLQSRDVSVVVDGQRVQGACPNHMDPPAFHVDLAEVQRVELAKGPFDVRHQGSLGGAVNIVTQRPGGGWHGVLNVAMGSAAYANPSATASHGGPKFSLLGGGSWRRGDAYEDGSGAAFTRPANYRPSVSTLPAFAVATGWARLAWTPTAGHTWQASYTRQDSGLVLYPALQMDAPSDDTTRVSLRYESADGPAGSEAIGIHAYYTAVDHWMTDEHRVSAAVSARGYSMATQADTATVGARVEGTWRGIAFGGEASQRRWDTETRLAARQFAPQASLADATITGGGAYAETTRALGSRAALDLGGRVDRVSSRVDDTGLNTALYRAYHGRADLTHADTMISGKARVTTQLGGDATVTFGAGRSMRGPDQQERYFALSRMGSDWVGNPGLVPSANTGLEAGLAVAARGAVFGAQAFAWWIDDFIAVRPTARREMVTGVMNVNARTFANLDAFVRGAELSGRVPLGRGLTAIGSLALLRGTGRGPDADDLAEMPPSRATLAVRYDSGRFGLTLEGVGAARQPHVDDALAEATTPGFVVLNARGSLTFRRVVAAAGVTNLLDRTYAEHLSYQRDPFRAGIRVLEPGRTLFVNAALRF